MRCQYILPDNLWQADIDRAQISQVIQNLTLNARQAMNDSGILTISGRNTAKTELPEEAYALSPDNYVCITLHDTGPGIPAAIIDRVFDPYFSTKERDATKGSGLGLAIVHSIMTKHNGLVTLHSSPEQGTTFSLYLPARVTPQTDQRQELTKTTPSAASRTIMVMDDEEIIRDVAKEMLEYLGYQVILVQDGHEAIATYHRRARTEHPIDAVLMDLTIPGGMGGKTAIGELLALHPEAKVIVTSGYADDPIMADYAQYGFAATITKPFSLETFTSVLHTLFR